MKQNGRRLLIGRDEIIEYLSISKGLFYNFVEMGLPAVVIKNRWYAHKDNIDNFFQSLTRHRIREIPRDAE